MKSCAVTVTSIHYSYFNSRTTIFF